jgi:hypothetical protein
MQLGARIKRYITTHERYIMPLALLLGFVVDNLTLTRVDQLFDNLILCFYVILAAITLFILYGLPQHTDRVPSKALGTLTYLAPYVFQYAIGGLFSGLFIFYFRSGTIGTSFPFLVILLVLMLGADYFYKRFPKASFQLVIFYIALLSYCNLVVPIVTKHLSLFSFLGATTLASALMYSFIMLLDRPKSLIRGENKKRLERRLMVTCAVFLFLYFTNTIPPLPLSMKTGVIAYNIERHTQDSYNITVEEPKWYTPFDKYSKKIHSRGPVYAFSSIFAPAELETDIYHRWSQYVENDGWVEISRIPIKIIGGREQGFRGYSLKNNVTPGTWRVDVITERGQVIGRIPFTITEDTNKNTEVQVY